MGEPVEDDDIKEMCKLAGVDGDGKLNYYGEQLQQRSLIKHDQWQSRLLVANSSK